MLERKETKNGKMLGLGIAVLFGFILWLYLINEHKQ